MTTRPTFECPWCRCSCGLEQLHAIAESADLPSDPVLDGSPLRFRPSRFEADGTPIDPKGAACRQLACPTCREAIPFGAVGAETIDVGISPQLAARLEPSAAGDVVTQPLRLSAVGLPVTPREDGVLAVALVRGQLCRLTRGRTEAPFQLDLAPDRDNLVVVPVPPQSEKTPS